MISDLSRGRGNKRTLDDNYSDYHNYNDNRNNEPNKKPRFNDSHAVLSYGVNRIVNLLKEKKQSPAGGPQVPLVTWYKDVEQRDSFLKFMKKIAREIENTNPNEWPPTNIRQVFNAFHGIDDVPEEVAQVFAALTKKINKTERFNSLQLRDILYGLESMPARSSYVEDVLNAVMNEENLNQALQFDNLHMVMAQLQKISKEYPPIRRLLNICAKVLNSSEKELGTKEMNMIFLGLYGMLECEETKNILKALTRKMKNMSEPFNTQVAAVTLKSLKNLSADSQEVLDLLAAVGKKIADMPGLLGVQAVGMALYGLQSMSSEPEEVRYVLSVLVNKISKMKERLSPQALGMALYGLKSMSSKSQEVRNLLGVLVGKVGSLDAQAASNALYGLQRMSSEYKEVRAV